MFLLPQIVVSLPVMTEKERLKQEALLKRVKELEKQLEDAQMKNIALETLIDVAEEQLNIPIRKKLGPGSNTPATDVSSLWGGIHLPTVWKNPPGVVWTMRAKRRSVAFSHYGSKVS
jgi:hypothetical protein